MMEAERFTSAYIVVFGVALVLAGCTEPETYPLTGKECGPEDPVLSIDAGDCAVPGSASGL